MLDPLARHDFMATVMTAVAEDGVSVVLSSHVLAELERVADYLILLSQGPGAGGRRGRRPARQPPHADRPGRRGRQVHRAAERGARPARPRRRPTCWSGPAAGDPVPPGWEAHPVSLEELVLAYLREPGAAALPGPARSRRRRADGGGEMTALTIPARPAQDARLRPVPWRRMAWVTWRQHRSALAGVAALLGAVAVYL